MEGLKGFKIISEITGNGIVTENYDYMSIITYGCIIIGFLAICLTMFEILKRKRNYKSIIGLLASATIFFTVAYISYIKAPQYTVVKARIDKYEYTIDSSKWNIKNISKDGKTFIFINN